MHQIYSRSNQNYQNTTSPNEESKVPIDPSSNSGVEFYSSYHEKNKNAPIPIAVHLKNYRYKSSS